MFDNEKHYMGNGSVKSKDNTTRYHHHSDVRPDIATHSKSTLPTPTTPTQSQPLASHQPIKLESSSNIPAKSEETVATPTTIIISAHDNSFTSDPSEATNTISDDATVISKVENISEKSEEISSSISQEHHTNGTIESNHKNSKELNKKASHSESSSNNSGAVKKCASSPPNKIQIDSAEVYQIIDSIRQTTSLSHKLSCVALRVVLSELEAIYSSRILPFLEPIAVHLTGTLPAPDAIVEHTHDSQRLKIIFSQLADCKNDSEQRTWILHEDEQYITKFLTELIEILVN